MRRTVSIPFRQRPFTVMPFTIIWTATVISNIDCWMYEAAPERLELPRALDRADVDRIETSVPHLIGSTRIRANAGVVGSGLCR
jgi:hypothetical protein